MSRSSRRFLCCLAAAAGLGAAAAAAPTWTDDLSPIAAADWNAERAAHLVERAGFGGTPEEIQHLASLTPQQAVDSLVDYQKIDNSAAPAFEASGVWDAGMDPFPPSRAEAVRLGREHGEALGVKVLPDGSPRRLQPVVDKFFYGLRANSIETQRLGVWWANRMLTTKRPLEEKLTLFWHGHFATGDAKVRDARMMLRQNEMLRRHAEGRLRDLLVGILEDPAMLVYLDNGENVKKHPNENFGRELLELFTMGVGRYTERDVREAARAFTGWTNDVLQFKVDKEQHDFGDKTFLGRTGPLDGTDIIDTILNQDATACAFRLASSFSSFSSRCFEAASFSFLSASRSISSWSERRSRDSSSSGMLSISVRSLAAASRPAVTRCVRLSSGSSCRRISTARRRWRRRSRAQSCWSSRRTRRWACASYRPFPTSAA